MRIELSHLETELGRIVVAATEAGLCAVDFAASDAPMRERLKQARPDATFGPGPRARAAAGRLEAYFEGELDALASLEVAPDGTDFQRKVWSALRQIPVGATCSYREIAGTIGQPTAMRAVGAANGRNPIALVVPCHRVIAADGTLGGYAGGLWRKQWLLKHERALLA